MQLYGNSLNFDFISYYGQFDFVLVDDCQHYEYVKSDTYNAFKLLRRNGIIVWHDFVVYASGVVKVINELVHNGYKLSHVQERDL
ncbi:MAG: class I SAM-dependent methyltransferase [Thermodesulfovibrionales bacterium]|nr:class I SAM-dependent methyltransferase [Thermodesulfovibrionales bacterium]